MNLFKSSLQKMLTIALVTVSAQTSFAISSSSGVLVNVNAYMYEANEKLTPGGDSKTNTSIYDIKVGYLTGSGLYLGGIYTTRSHTSGTTTDGNATGASIGYVGSSGFFIKGHYLLSGEYGEMKEGSGYQVDFGYLTNVTRHFMVGVELTHRSMTYKDVPGADKYELTETFPMLTVGFVF